jgi:hypothetical protein
MKAFKSTVVRDGNTEQCYRIMHKSIYDAAVCGRLVDPAGGIANRHWRFHTLRTRPQFFSMEEFDDSGSHELPMDAIMAAITPQTVCSFASHVKKASGNTYAAFKYEDAISKNLYAHTHADLVQAAQCCDILNDTLSVNSSLRLTDRRLVEMSFDGGRMISWRIVSPREIEEARVGRRTVLAG